MKIQRSRGSRARRITVVVLIAAVVALLIAAAMIIVPILTHENAGSSGQTAPDGFSSTATATGDDGRTRTLQAQTVAGEPADLSQISPGDELLIAGSGFDASIGIYVAICAIPSDPTARPSPCLGGVPDDAEEEKDPNIGDEALESAWVTNNWAWRGFASHTFTDAEAGEFEVRLLVPPASTDGLDCRVDACAVFTRADHTALNDRIQDMYLPVAFR